MTEKTMLIVAIAMSAVALLGWLCALHAREEYEDEAEKRKALAKALAIASSKTAEAKQEAENARSDVTALRRELKAANDNREKLADAMAREARENKIRGRKIKELRKERKELKYTAVALYCANRVLTTGRKIPRATTEKKMPRAIKAVPQGIKVRIRVPASAKPTERRTHA